MVSHESVVTTRRASRRGAAGRTGIESAPTPPGPRLPAQAHTTPDRPR
jgi:hypothetical protein